MIDRATTRVTNILLVEDDEVDVMNVRRAFQQNQIINPLYIARDGIEALEMLRGSRDLAPVIPCDRRIILLDINMPKMNGIEFLEEVRTDPALRLTPIVVLTTSDHTKDRVEAYKFNIAGYMLKPLTFDVFSDIMATLNHYWNLCEMP